MVSFINLLVSSLFSVFFFSMLLVPSFYVFGSVSVTSGNKEANALLKWKASLDDQNQSFLSSWHGNGPCNWTGITCDESRSVVHLNLSSSGLKGTLHGFSFSSFAKLTFLDLSYNYLVGTIPSDVGTLSRLTCLNLSSNYLSGTIPFEIGNLTRLVDIELDNNTLSGSIPPQIGMLASLEKLSLGSTSFTGEIPVSFGNLKNLSILYLFNNALSGSIPNNIGNLKNLSKLWLYNNGLSGSIPSSIGNLTNLIELSMSSNQLEDSIAWNEIAKHENFQHLHLFNI